VYDGFISYSHAADDLLAPRLQAGLQRFAKPWWKRRALRVFRDEASLSANPHLWSSITEALDRSEWFVLLLSEDAAASDWVDREVAWWLEHKDPGRIIPVVTDGEFGWADGDISPVSTAAPPSLHGAFSDEPRWVDLRFARSETQLDLRHTEFRSAIADIASAIRGVPKDELESEEIRQHKRTTRTAWTAATALGVLLIAAVVATVVAIDQQAQARQQQEIAEANAAAEVEQRRIAEAAGRRSLAQALASRSIITLDTDHELALLLAIEAVETTRGPDGFVLRDAEEALHRALQSFRLVQTLDGGSDLAVLPNGNIVVAGDGVTILEADTRRKLATLPTGGRSLAVDVSPDGSLIAIGGSDGTVAAWDGTSETPTVLRRPEAGQAREIREVRFSPDGSLVSWGDEGGFSSVQPLDEDTPATPLERVDIGHSNVEVRAAFSPDGTWLVVAGDISWAYHLASGTGMEFSAGTVITDVAFASDGSTLIAVNEDGTATLWDVADAVTLRVSYDLGELLPSAIAIDPSGTMVAVGFESGGIRVFSFDEEGLSELYPLRGHRAAIGGLTFVPDTTRLVSTSNEATRVWDVGTAGQREWFTISGSSRRGADLAFSPDGAVLAVARDEAVIGLYDATTGDETGRLRPSTPWPGFAASIAFTPDGNHLAASFIDPRQYPMGFMRVFDLETHKEMVKLPGLWQVGLTTSRDGRFVASAGPGGVTLYDLESGEPVDAILGTGTETARLVAFSRDGRLLAFADASGHIDIFDFTTRVHLAETDHPMPLEMGRGSIEFSDDGKALLTAGREGTAVMWDAESGHELASFEGHVGDVNVVRFSPDGGRIATGGADGVVRLWSVTDEGESSTLRFGGASVDAVSFSADGSRLAILSADGTVEVYALDLEDLLSLARSRTIRTLTPDECVLYLQQESCPEVDR
jgi:WD40 repeat protein